MTPPSPNDASYPREAAQAMQTNSWFFVPLLLQVAGLLAEEWRAHPVGGQRWERLSEALVAAPAVPVADFLAIVHAVALVEEQPANADVADV